MPKENSHAKGEHLTGEHPCQGVISIKLLCNFIEIILRLRYGCSPVNLLHIFRIRFSRNTSGGASKNFPKNVFRN